MVTISTDSAALASFKGTDAKASEAGERGSPLAVFLVEKQLPGLVFLLLHPDAIFPGRNRNVTKSQVGFGLEGCGGVSPHPPKVPWFQIAEPLSMVWPFREGRPYSTETVFPLRVKVEVARGFLADAAQEPPPRNRPPSAHSALPSQDFSYRSPVDRYFQPVTQFASCVTLRTYRAGPRYFPDFGLRTSDSGLFHRYFALKLAAASRVPH